MLDSERGATVDEALVLSHDVQIFLKMFSVSSLILLGRKNRSFVKGDGRDVIITSRSQYQVRTVVTF